jgi:hypothetical protein
MYLHCFTTIRCDSAVPCSAMHTENKKTLKGTKLACITHAHALQASPISREPVPDSSCDTSLEWTGSERLQLWRKLLLRSSRSLPGAQSWGTVHSCILETKPYLVLCDTTIGERAGLAPSIQALSAVAVTYLSLTAFRCLPTYPIQNRR